jgi:2-keto-4-pentenoate hydratase/2-oxohepta-3-ene-1,7-dioic acid hydratase in catechol pathway
VSSYRLLTYDFDGQSRAGLLVDGRVHDLAHVSGVPEHASVFDLLQAWDTAQPMLERVAASVVGTLEGRALREEAIRVPITHPVGIFCAGANYRDHILEMARVNKTEPDPDPRAAGLKSWHFLKHYRTLSGHGAKVRLPPSSNKVDWEAELAVVIGRSAKDVSPDKALQHVAGYLIANDLSARDLSRRAGVPEGSPFRFDWLAHKNFDGSCPIGPWITPASAIADPQRLSIRLKVDGETMQDSNTSEMIYDVAEQISHLSEKLTLHPGDIVLTGTPAGVGGARNRYLKSGSRIEIEIENLGALRHEMI